MLRIGDSRELQAVILSIRQANRDVQTTIREQSRKVIVPEWQKGVEARAHSTVEKRFLGGTARAKVGNQNVELQAGGLSRKLSGGFSTNWVGESGKTNGAGVVEFGGNRTYFKNYQTRSRKGKSYNTKRHTQRQLTQFRKAGPTYKTVENMVPRIASLWIQTTVRVFRDAFEGK